MVFFRAELQQDGHELLPPIHQQLLGFFVLLFDGWKSVFENLVKLLTTQQPWNVSDVLC